MPALCTLSDIALICGGIFGGSALLNQSPLLLMLITWAGVAFLTWYGWGALRNAWQGDVSLASTQVMKQGRWRIIATMLAVPWLNPHVYIDTFVVLGSLGGQLPSAEARRWFALGSVSASVIWFFGLALLAAWAALVAKAAPVDVVNVPVPVAWVAVVVQVACAARKRSWRLLSTSLKLYLKTSSWHFFFVSRTGCGTPTYFFAAVVSLLSPRFVILRSAISWWLHYYLFELINSTTMPIKKSRLIAGI